MASITKPLYPLMVSPHPPKKNNNFCDKKQCILSL